MSNHHSICSTTCNGTKDAHGLCCHKHVGIHLDGEEFLKNLSEFLGYHISKEEVYIEYEEGKNFKTSNIGKESWWQNPNVYPTLRLDTSLPNNPCIFYDVINKKCNVYHIRPKTCRDFECDFLKNQKLIQLKKA